MTSQQVQETTPQIQNALDELKRLLTEEYPEATFEVAPGIDDPGSKHLMATIDAEDVDAVLDVIGDRLLSFQVEEGLPIHVIPVLPLTGTAEGSHKGPA